MSKVGSNMSSVRSTSLSSEDSESANLSWIVVGIVDTADDQPGPFVFLDSIGLGRALMIESCKCPRWSTTLELV